VSALNRRCGPAQVARLGQNLQAGGCFCNSERYSFTYGFSDDSLRTLDGAALSVTPHGPRLQGGRCGWRATEFVGAKGRRPAAGREVPWLKSAAEEVNCAPQCNQRPIGPNRQRGGVLLSFPFFFFFLVLFFFFFFLFGSVLCACFFFSLLPSPPSLAPFSTFLPLCIFWNHWHPPQLSLTTLSCSYPNFGVGRRGLVRDVNRVRISSASR